jgi:hypothetical protein
MRKAKQQKYTLNLVGSKDSIFIVDISKVRFSRRTFFIEFRIE